MSLWMWVWLCGCGDECRRVRLCVCWVWVFNFLFIKEDSEGAAPHQRALSRCILVGVDVGVNVGVHNICVCFWLGLEFTVTVMT